MRALTNVFFVLIALLILEGCAIGPGFTEFSPNIPNLAPDSGRIYFYRKSGIGPIVQPEVKLNGEVIGRAVPKGFFYVDKPSGTYAISTSSKENIFVNLHKGEVLFVRLEILPDVPVGYISPKLSRPEVGRIEIEDCRYAGQ